MKWLDCGGVCMSAQLPLWKGNGFLQRRRWCVNLQMRMCKTQGLYLSNSLQHIISTITKTQHQWTQWHTLNIYIRQYYGHFEMINIQLVQQQFCRSIINSSNDFCASRSSLHFTNLVCIKCITVLYQPPCFIDIRPLRNFDPHINTTDGCVSLYSSSFTIVLLHHVNCTQYL